MNLLALTCAELAHEMERCYGKGFHHASALYREVFKRGNRSLAEVPEFRSSLGLAERVANDLRLPSCRIVSQQEDEVLKFASELADGHVIETVVIPARGRTTLCVSSQVGCRMGCRFCTTGGMGFVRNLSAEEIVWQVYAARFTLGHTIDNLVFMGMGEPLDNFDNLLQAIHVLNDQRGLDIALSHMTLSTAGHAEGLQKLAWLNLKKLRLAISLNAADNALRNQLMPINRRFPLERLRAELLSYPLARDSVLFIEYVLLAGVNDSPHDAGQLVDFLAGSPPVRVNLIPFNGDGSTPFIRPTADEVKRFQDHLTAAGIFVRVRQSRGHTIQAGCGQLGAALAANDQRTRCP